MSRRKTNRIEEVEVTGIAHKSYVVGRTDEGLVVFTKNALPGDRVRVSLNKKRKGIFEGKVTNRIFSSPWRVEPVCSHYGVCGGCSMQDLSIEEQLRQKSKLALDAFQRIAKISDFEFEPILACLAQYAYRNKMDFTFTPDRWKTKEEWESEDKTNTLPALGFHRPESFHKVVHIHQCHLQISISNQIRNFVWSFAIENNWTFYNIKRHEGWLRNLMIRTNREGKAMLILSVNQEDKEKIKSLFEALKLKFPEVVSLFYTINSKLNDAWSDLDMIHYSGAKYLQESLDHVNYFISPKSFFQTNTSQAERLYRIVKEYAEPNPNEVIYDLYCGVGSIGLYLAKDAKMIIGIEQIEEAIEDAKYNANHNALSNCHFFAGDTKKVLQADFYTKYGKADTVILDPPRSGLHDAVIQQVLELAPQKIVYVSCNPATQARDISMLESAYKLTKLRPVDMFPNTHHVESVAQLIKK